MCGRYTLYIGTEDEDIVNIVHEIEKNMQTDRLNSTNRLLSPGEIYPTNAAPVLTLFNHRRTPELFTWGFPNFHNKGVIINARAETVTEKPMFRPCFFNRRCVVPSTGFFEWDKNKTKYLFRLPNSDIVYMAGLYNEFNGEKRFLILTTAANSSMSNVHSRMPVVLSKTALNDWLSDFDKADALIRQTPPKLAKQAVSSS